MSFKKKLKQAYLVLLVIIPIILLILPANYFDIGQSVCLSILLLDKSCYACGMTRAIQHLIHFDFIEAWSFNKLSFIVFPLLAVSYIKELMRLYTSLKK